MIHKDFSLYDLDAALKHKNIVVVENPQPEGILERRTKRFVINGQSYKIIWYVNACHLIHNDITVPFTSVAKKNTWPTNSKMNLQFYNEHNKVCCIISIENRRT